MCQWRRELLAGLLANDLLAFQVERDRRNFILAVQDELGAEIEADGASVRFKGRSTTVVSVPIGVDYDRIQGVVTARGIRRRPAAACVQMFGLDGDEHRRRRASIGSTTRKGFPSGSKRSIAC